MKKELTIGGFFEWLHSTTLRDTCGDIDADGHFYGKEIREDRDGRFWLVEIAKGRVWEDGKLLPRYIIEEGNDHETFVVHEVKMKDFMDYCWETDSGRRIYNR